MRAARIHLIGSSPDLNGKVTSITYPSGDVAAFTRTTDGLITAVSWTPAGHGAVNLATSIAYEPFGPLASLTFGNGLGLTQTWDADYRLTDSKLASGAGSVLDFAPAWQPDGRIASLTDNAGTGRAAAFSYTPSGRVQGASGPWGTGTSAYAYSYDAAGNQTQAGPYGAPIIATVNSANNQITTTTAAGATQRSLGYTPGGLLTGDTWAGGTNWTFTYNAARRLTQVKANSANSGQYAYDFQGQRVWRLTQGGGGSQTAYVYDEAGHLLAEHSMNSGAMSREYVWLDDQPIATVYLASGVPTIAYIHTGQIGEPLAMTSASRALLWNGYVDPFGTAGTFSAPAVSLDMRLPGQSYQAEADNFSQNHWRDYDPTLGRYSEPDPLGIDAGQNLYAYVDGDGLNLSDPSGLQVINPLEATCVEPIQPICWAGLGLGAVSLGVGIYEANQAVQKFAPPQSSAPATTKNCPDQFDYCREQWIDDTRWCDRNFIGRKNVACHAWAAEEFERCKKNQRRQPFRL